MTITDRLAIALVNDIDPSPKAPPGLESKVNTLLSAIMWVAIVACVLGFFICAIRLAVAVRRGELGESMSSLGGPAIACVLIGGAASLVNFLVL